MVDGLTFQFNKILEEVFSMVIGPGSNKTKLSIAKILTSLTSKGGGKEEARALVTDYAKIILN